jgi:protein SCO1/2
VDFQCPICRAWECEVRSYVDRQVAYGALSVEYHPIAIFDRASTTQHSTRSARRGLRFHGEVAKVVDTLHNLLDQNQPADGGAGPPDSELADQTGTTGLASCIQITTSRNGWATPPTRHLKTTSPERRPSWSTVTSSPAPTVGSPLCRASSAPGLLLGASDQPGQRKELPNMGSTNRISPRRPQRCRRRFRAVVAASALTLTGCASGAATPPTPGHDVGTRLDGPVSPAIAHLTLTAENGRRASLADYRGKVLVVVPAMTLCQETCPLDVANSVSALRAINRAGLKDSVELVTVTVDPWRDTPGRMQAYRELFSPPANWVALTGSPRNVNRFWDYFGVYRKRVHTEARVNADWLTGRPLRFDVQHSDEVFFVDQDLHERFVLEGPARVSEAGDLPVRLRNFLNGEGLRHLARPAPSTWSTPQLLQVVAWLTGQAIPGAAGTS